MRDPELIQFINHIISFEIVRAISYIYRNKKKTGKKEKIPLVVKLQFQAHFYSNPHELYKFNLFPHFKNMSF